jgi:uncharacterized protein YbbC (DUF1343 family)
MLVLTSVVGYGQIRVGAEILLSEQFSLVEGKRIGLVTNHTGRLSNGTLLADTLFANARTSLIALFGPEHGIRGDAPDGKSTITGVDERTRLPAYSLYGETNKPTPQMLENVDVLLFDIQDVGARFYTYESTMSLAMEAAAERGIPFIVLDRPNPLGGTHVDGFILDHSLRSFVGMHRIPIQHGLTIGELARLINAEGWLRGGVKANLTVVKMEGWQRDQWYDETGIPWVKPSPNMKTLETAVVYPGTCLFEGTNLSEGRGTDRPFEYLGAPFIDGRIWASELNNKSLAGVQFEPIEFVPKAIPNVASNPKFRGEKCGGVFVRVTDRQTFEPIRSAIAMLITAKKLFPGFQWNAYIDKLAGTPRLRNMIDAGTSFAQIASSWMNERNSFIELRKKYLLY